MRALLALTFAALVPVGAWAQPAPAANLSNEDYMKRAAMAAPPHLVADATIVRMSNGAMQTLKPGSNGWTCMIGNPDVPMCLDPNAMEWAHAWQTHGAPTTKTGFIYMLAGDTGASNTDPWAPGKTADNHWVQTGAHVMIVGAAAATMAGYSRSADPDPTKPYVMWPGSPYEHLMIPVK